jgi:hypothetical protein
MKFIKNEKKKKKTENTTRQSAQKKTYNLTINYIFALATNSRVPSSSSRVTIFLLQPGTVHNQLSFHFRPSLIKFGILFLDAKFAKNKNSKLPKLSGCLYV